MDSPVSGSGGHGSSGGGGGGRGPSGHGRRDGNRGGSGGLAEQELVSELLECRNCYSLQRLLQLHRQRLTPKMIW